MDRVVFLLHLNPKSITNAKLKGTTICGKGCSLQDLPIRREIDPHLPKKVNIFTTKLVKEIYKKYGKLFNKLGITVLVNIDKGPDCYYYKIMFIDKNKQLVEKVDNAEEMKQKYPWVLFDDSYTSFGENFIGFPNEKAYRLKEYLAIKKGNYIHKKMQITYEGKNLSSYESVTNSVYKKDTSNKRVDYVYLYSYFRIYEKWYLTDVTLEQMNKIISDFVNNLEIKSLI